MEVEKEGRKGSEAQLIHDPSSKMDPNAAWCRLLYSSSCGLF